MALKPFRHAPTESHFSENRVLCVKAKKRQRAIIEAQVRLRPQLFLTAQCLQRNKNSRKYRMIFLFLSSILLTEFYRLSRLLTNSFFICHENTSTGSEMKPVLTYIRACESGQSIVSSNFLFHINFWFCFRLVSSCYISSADSTMIELQITKHTFQWGFEMNCRKRSLNQINTLLRISWKAG